MGCTCSQEALMGLFAGFHKQPPQAMLPAPSRPQSGTKCTIQHRTTRRSFVRKLYDVSADAVGEGAYGTVRETWSRKTGAAYVMKTVAKKDKRKAELASLADEIAIHQMCDHPGIVRIIESFEDGDHVHIAMEACKGGELADFVQAQGGTLNEPDARIMMQQVLQAVFYLHAVKNVAHRDLKPENLLMKFPSLSLQDNSVKLIDFGFAKGFTPGESSLTDVCGTPVYMAPEMLHGPYSEKCDLWSCGSLLHEVISGHVPFDGPSPLETLRMAAANPVQLGSEGWDAVSEEAKALVLGMLTRNPDDRLSAEQALQAPWLGSVALESHGIAFQSSDSSCKAVIAKNLRAFSTLNGFKKAALRVAAYHLDDPQVAKQRGAFKLLDKNGDGRLSFEELDNGCPELGLTAQEAHQLFWQLDTDGSGTIEYSEFLSAAICKPRPRQRRGLPRIALPLLLGFAAAAGLPCPKLFTRGPATQSSGGLAFNVPARTLLEPRRRRGTGAFVAARRPGTLKAAWLGQEAERPSKRRGASAVTLLAGKPAVERGSLAAILRTAAKVLALAGAAVAGLVALLYVTSGFEACMEAASGSVAGKSPLVAGVIGLAVGALHTFAGPDHLAGLAPLVIGQGRSLFAAFGLGALWGSGHATGQMLLGFACLLAQIGILRMAWADAFSQASSALIGASLIGIGLLGLNETRKFTLDGTDGELSARPRFGFATYFTGVLHGLSLDAILFISPALALPRIAAALHILGVCVGTLLSMGVYTTLLSRLCTRGPRLQLVSGGASVVAMLLGACILLASLGLTVGLPGL